MKNTSRHLVLISARTVLGVVFASLFVAGLPLPSAGAQDTAATKTPLAKLSSDQIKPGVVDTTGAFHTKVNAWRIARKGWVPSIEVLVHLPGIAQEDALMVQFKKGSKKLGKPHACEPTKVLNKYQENQTTPVFESHFAFYECKFPDSYAQKKAGSYSLDLSVRQPLLEKSTSIGSLQLKVMDIKQGSQNTQTTLQNDVQDALVGPALLYEQSRYSGGNGLSLKSIADAHHRAWLDAPHHDSTGLSLVFWTKNEKEHKQGRHTVACLYNGQKVAAKGAGYGGSGRSSSEYWTFKGKDKKVVRWSEHNYSIHGLRVRSPARKDAPPNNDQWHYLDKNPGKYECKIIAGGAVQGSVLFEVKDGEIVRNECQDDINTTDNVYVVPFKDKGMSKAKLDKKLQKRAFNGPRSWSRGCPPNK